MAAPAHPDERAYLTIVIAPPGLEREDLAALLAPPTGADVASLRLRLAQAPPAIVGLCEPAGAAAAVAAVTAAGGDAFACTLADLARLGGTLKIKDMRLVEGALEIDLWRGLSTTLRRDQIQILVRAHLRRSEPGPPRPMDGPRWSRHVAGFGLGAGPGALFGLGGAAGTALAFESAYLARDASGERVTTTSDKLDIHATDGSVYQVDGDKFGYRILGALRGYGDRENMDRMCELLSHLAPDEIVDPYFSLWRPPPGYDRLRLPEMRINRDDPAFAFYSRWAALMYRHLMGW